jgi:hypothetical protein
VGRGEKRMSSKKIVITVTSLSPVVVLDIVANLKLLVARYAIENKIVEKVKIRVVQEEEEDGS